MRWTIVIGGFRQKRGVKNGAIRLYKKLLDHENTEHLVLFREWDHDFRVLADKIADQPVERVHVFAYSWGAGRGFLQLAGALKEAEVPVHRAVLCDPVYHSWLPAFRWLALVHWLWRPKIVLPRNVQACDVFFQERDRPRAAPVVRDNGHEWPINRHKLFAAHIEMDDAPAFHHLCLKLTQQ